MKRPLFVIIAAIIVLGVVVAFLRLAVGGDEDAWVCENNAWVKHGNPSAAAPTTGCGITELSCESISNQAECQMRTDCLPIDSCVCTTDYEKAQRCTGTIDFACDCWNMGGFERCATLVCDSLSNTNSVTNTSNSNSVHIDNDFNTKVVYTISASSASEITAFENDCRQRGGTFSTCGSPCEPGASICASVCAYTCDSIPE